MLPGFIYVLKFLGVFVFYEALFSGGFLFVLLFLDEAGVWWALEDITGSIWFVLTILWLPFAIYFAGKKVFDWDIYEVPAIAQRRNERRAKRARRKAERRKAVAKAIDRTTEVASLAAENVTDISALAIGCSWLLLPVLLLAIVILLIILLTR